MSNWPAEWAEAHRQPGVSFPDYVPVARFYTDVGKRASKCRVCSEAIPKKTARAVFALSFGRFRRFQKGGGVSGQKFFCHVDCIRNILDGVNEAPRTRPGHCSDCDAVTDTSVAKTLGSSLFVLVCEECAVKYTECAICRRLFGPHQISRVVGAFNTKYMGKFACDRCVEYDEIYTVKERKRKQLADIRLERKVDKIKDFYSIYLKEDTGGEAEDAGEPVRQG